jgi:hypothetical protein
MRYALSRSVTRHEQVPRRSLTKRRTFRGGISGSHATPVHLDKEVLAAS